MELFADFSAAVLGTIALSIGLYALSPLLTVVVGPILLPAAFMFLRT